MRTSPAPLRRHPPGWVIGSSGSHLPVRLPRRMRYDWPPILQPWEIRGSKSFRNTARTTASRPRNRDGTERDPVMLRVLESLATDPMLTVESVAVKQQVSSAAAHRALVELADPGILGRSKDHRGRLICWTPDRYLDLVALTGRGNCSGQQTPLTSVGGWIRPDQTTGKQNCNPRYME